MAYGLPHRGGRQILLMSLPAAMHQVVLSREPQQKYPHSLPLNGNFSEIHFHVRKLSKKLYRCKRRWKVGTPGLKTMIQNDFLKKGHTGAQHGSLQSCKRSRQDKSKRNNLPQFEFARVLPCKYLHSPCSSLGCVFLSTCRLMPLLAAGRQVNWFPPPRRRQGSTLMKLRLGALVLPGYTHTHTRGNDILGPQ